MPIVAWVHETAFNIGFSILIVSALLVTLKRREELGLKMSKSRIYSPTGQRSPLGHHNSKLLGPTHTSFC
jgi:hypothetical protein